MADNLHDRSQWILGFKVKHKGGKVYRSMMCCCFVERLRLCCLVAGSLSLNEVYRELSNILSHRLEHAALKRVEGRVCVLWNALSFQKPAVNPSYPVKSANIKSPQMTQDNTVYNTEIFMTKTCNHVYACHQRGQWHSTLYILRAPLLQHASAVV